MKTEKRIIQEYLFLANDTDSFARKYRKFSIASYMVGWLCIFTVVLGILQNYEPSAQLVLFGFLGGMTCTAGIWFGQACSQANVLAPHLATESLERRKNELST